MAFRPLPTDDFGRDADLTLEAGQPQTQASHEHTNIQPALFIHANFYRRAAVLDKADLQKLKDARSGFAVEMGDEEEYGSFAKFQAHVRAATLTGDPKTTVTYVTGEDTLAASWDSFTVNGNDPYASLSEDNLWQDTTLSQMGMARRLEKSGAVVERDSARGKNPLMLQVLPKSKTFVCTNPVPGYKAYRFSTPDGVRIAADGLCSMGQWAVVNAREVRVRYAAFDLPAKNMPPIEQQATCLFISGTDGKPQVILNAEDVTGKIKGWKQNGVEGWLVPLTATFPKDEEITARLAAIEAAIDAK
jgi:hypothetical protein